MRGFIHDARIAIEVAFEIGYPTLAWKIFKFYRDARQTFDHV